MAFLKHGYVNTVLEIPSCPDIAALDGFWEFLLELCAPPGATDQHEEGGTESGVTDHAGASPNFNYEWH